MNLIKTITTGLLIAGIISFTAYSPPKPFTDLLDRAKMTFENPAGLVETGIVKNEQMSYEYAVKYPDKKFEVRYAIRPLDDLIKDYEEKEKNKKPGETNTHPNKLYSSLFRVTALNISGGQLEDIIEFDAAKAKEYNADWGAKAIVAIGKEFGGADYKYGIVIGLHKDNLGDAFMFFLSDTQDGIEEKMKPALMSLKFK